MIYVPDLNYACYVVHDKDTIRAYKIEPTQNSQINYRDFFINSNYIFKDGTQIFRETVPVCLDNSILTDSVYYRNDFDRILIIFLILCIFCFYIPIKIFSRIFKRGRI